MTEPLAGRLSRRGPIYDRAAASRMRDQAAETGLSLPDAALDALAWAASASPYLARLARDEGRLRRVLLASPEEALETILAAAGELERAPGEMDVGKGLLRRLKADLHLLTALCDLSGVWALEAVTSALSRFADAALRAAVAIAASTEARAGRTMGPLFEGAPPGFFAVALGKHGAFELNYSSDIDIAFFFDAALFFPMEKEFRQQFALNIVKSVVDILQSRTEDGYVFRVDLRLRPDPLSTSAAMSTDAALEYYGFFGQNWERAALIKARVAAGDRAAGDGFLEALKPFIWRRNLDYAAIMDIHAIKRQIHVHKVDERLTAPGADLKLGAGGIREVEFFVQTQQLIYGGRETGLRSPTTLGALQALRTAGYVAPSVHRDMAAAYARLRALEHRIQMINDEQTHVLPEAPTERRRVAVLYGVGDLGAFDGAVSRTLKRVNARYGELFAADEPLSSRFGSLVFTGVDDDPETLRTLQRMGYSNPAQVSGLIRSWHHGRIAATRSERGRELFTRLAPRLLEAAFATGAPDTAFNRFADFFSNLRAGVQVQALFLAEPKLFARLVDAMAFAPRLALQLGRRPQVLDTVLDARFSGPIDAEDCARALEEAVSAADGFEAAMDAARRVHREEAFRIGMRVMSGDVNAGEAGLAFTGLAEACIRSLATAALNETARTAGDFPGDVAVLALGKAGSREMTARSDLDLMTLYRARRPDAASADKGWSAETFYIRFTQRLVAALSSPTSEGELYKVDLQLRPSGTAGPVAVSLTAFESYYDGEAETWEHLALTRARVVWASDPDFARLAERAVEAALRRPRDRSQAAADVRDMRSLMRVERPPWGRWDLKLAPGGLVDIEFAAQFLQIVGAAGGARLEPNTGEALRGLMAASPSMSGALERLEGAWRLQQDLSQVLKLALDEGQDPALEPPRFKRRLAAAAGQRSFVALERRLLEAQAGAAAAFEAVLDGR